MKILENKNINRNNKLLPMASLFVLLYFIFLVVISNYNVNIILLGVIVELLTIPFLILLLILFIKSIRDLIKSKFKIKSNSFVSFVLTIITILMLVIVTLTE